MIICGCQHSVSNQTRSSANANIESKSNPTFFSNEELNSDENEFEAIDQNRNFEEEELATEGFCRDDIYTQYLMDQYIKNNPTKPIKPAKKKVKNNNDSFTSAESEALHYATEILKGPIRPYYGSMPVVANRDVENWIRFYKTKGRSTFLKWVIRGESLRKIIQPILQEEGVPEELYYLAMVESGFNNKAYSPASATGTWQFMQGTAKAYHLKISPWVDERKDPAKSTRAAARFLKDLYTTFGDWYLAIAAYNSGPGKISSAMRKTGSRDYWQIADTKHIPTETKQYVPKILATITLASNLKEHGFEYKADPLDDLPLNTVKITRPVSLSEIASLLNISLSTLKSWNPEIIKDITPPKSKWSSQDGYELRISQHLVQRFINIEQQLSFLEIKDIKYYNVRPGDTLNKIAKRHNISVEKLVQYNPDMTPKKLKIGKQIAIPIPDVVATKKKA